MAYPTLPTCGHSNLSSLKMIPGGQVCLQCTLDNFKTLDEKQQGCDKDTVTLMITILESVLRTGLRKKTFPPQAAYTEEECQILYQEIMKGSMMHEIRVKLPRRGSLSINYKLGLFRKASLQFQQEHERPATKEELLQLIRQL